jgi:hypothetical protein
LCAFAHFANTFAAFAVKVDACTFLLLAAKELSFMFFLLLPPKERTPEKSG